MLMVSHGWALAMPVQHGRQAHSFSMHRVRILILFSAPVLVASHLFLAMRFTTCVAAIVCSWFYCSLVEAHSWGVGTEPGSSHANHLALHRASHNRAGKISNEGSHASEEKAQPFSNDHERYKANEYSDGCADLDPPGRSENGLGPSLIEGGETAGSQELKRRDWWMDTDMDLRAVDDQAKSGALPRELSSIKMLTPGAPPAATSTAATFAAATSTDSTILDIPETISKTTLALTTVFTPPPECTNGMTLARGYLWRQVITPAESVTLTSCYPSQFYSSAVVRYISDLPPFNQLVCPDRWDSHFLNKTYMICCPRYVIRAQTRLARTPRQAPC